MDQSRDTLEAGKSQTSCSGPGERADQCRNQSRTGEGEQSSTEILMKPNQWFPKWMWVARHRNVGGLSASGMGPEVNFGFIH